jgi:hypothetical protein
MKQIKDHTYHDQKRVNFSIDEDEYEAFVDYWYISEPEVNYFSIDEVWVNQLFKNGDEVRFVYQRNINKNIINAILKELGD